MQTHKKKSIATHKHKISVLSYAHIHMPMPQINLCMCVAMYTSKYAQRCAYASKYGCIGAYVCAYVCMYVYLEQRRAMEVLTIPSSLRSLPSLETSIEIHTGVVDGGAFSSGSIPMDIAIDLDRSEEKASIPNASRLVKYS